MDGKILAYNPKTAKGYISGADGVRYKFRGASFRDNAKKLTKGTAVDFVPNGEFATSIMLAGRSNAGSGEKSRIVAALLAFFLGFWGIHKFYLGKNSAGLWMLLPVVLGSVILLIPFLGVLVYGAIFAVIRIISLIEFVIYLLKSDEEFEETYVSGDKAWF
jgi:TM2 domain-containing membrane protein YozV